MIFPAPNQFASRSQTPAQQYQLLPNCAPPESYAKERAMCFVYSPYMNMDGTSDNDTIKVADRSERPQPSAPASSTANIMNSNNLAAQISESIKELVAAIAMYPISTSVRLHSKILRSTVPAWRAVLTLCFPQKTTLNLVPKTAVLRHR